MTLVQISHAGASLLWSARSYARTALLWTACSLVVAAAPARALPLYFDANLGVGFDPTNPDVVAHGVDLVLDGSHHFEAAGDPSLSPLLEVTTSLAAQPTVPASPSFTDPILADVVYTVTNSTGALLDDELLVFTTGDTLTAYPALTPEELGIDVPGMVLIQKASCLGNPGGPCVFGAVALPVMAPGAVFQFQIQHRVADTLSGSTVIPTPGLALLVHTAVPEPATAGLVLLGLGALRFRAPRSRDSASPASA